MHSLSCRSRSVPIYQSKDALVATINQSLNEPDHLLA